MNENELRVELNYLYGRKAKADAQPESSRRIYARTYARIVARIIELEKMLGETIEQRRQRISERYFAFYRELPYRVDAEALDLPEYTSLGIETYEHALHRAWESGDEQRYSEAERNVLKAYQELQRALEDRRQVRLA